MSDEKPDAAAAPAVLRQEGPHRVTVPAGSHTALSSSAAGMGSKRLRPAVGAVPPAAVDPALLPPLPQASLQRRNLSGGSSTEVRRIPGRAPVDGRFEPGAAEPGAAQRRALTSALEARMAELERRNQQTSQVVTALERSMSEDTTAQVAPEQPAHRSFFKRSSP